MPRVGLARTRPSYDGVTPPYPPGHAYPELARAAKGTAATRPYNHVYAAVRAALAGAGLDAGRYGSPDWNPLGELVARGGHVVLKPNFIRHYNSLEGHYEELDSVITHGALLRAICDYAFIAVGQSGRVTIAEAAQQDCDIEQIKRRVGLEALIAHYAGLPEPLTLSFLDLRREHVIFEGGIIRERHPLPGDPMGYRVVDLGERSFFTGSGLDPVRFRGADYDPAPTSLHHMGGRNEYLLAESVLSADLIVNLPKIKTHKKTGVTLALKNMVGINGDKNWLPHHSVGATSDGGDEFDSPAAVDRLRSWAVETTRPLLARGVFPKLFQAARWLETSARREHFVRAGNWYGNRTTWRMCCDLNRCVYYSDAKGLHLDAPRPVRPILTVLDGIVAGEGAGPLSTSAVALGAIVASVDPIAADLLAVRLMGFDPRRLPKVWEPIMDAGPRITDVRSEADVVVGDAGDLAQAESAEPQVRDVALRSIAALHHFAAHPGWLGHVESR